MRSVNSMQTNRRFTMKLKSLFGLFLSLVVLVMVGCGGGGGGTPTSTVNGVASKGPILGGTVQFFAIQSGVVAATPLTTTPATVTTSLVDGSYTANISYVGPALVMVTGGTYVDEATGATVPLTTPLRAALPNVTGTVTANVTPFTELAVQEAEALGGLTAANITSANAAISSMVGFDILTTSPADPAYALALAIISQVQVDTGTDLATAIANFSAGITVDPANNTATVAAPTQAVIDAAEASLTTNPNINPATLPMVVALTASPTTGVINNQSPVTVSAAVTFEASGLPVPAGIAVNFTVTSGTGTLSAASAATAAGGIASVTLNSTVVGSVVVSAATATSAAATITVPFIAQPTQAIVRLATIGTLPAGTLIGGINAIVTYTPAGLTIVDAGVALSGVGAGLLQPNTTVAGQVNLALVSTAGITTGEFATLTFSVAAGTFPTAADFSVALTGAGIIDTVGTAIPGIDVAILSVTLL
jgi:hypothetical protein